MEVRKSVAVISVIGALLIGGAVGALGDHYFYITKPYKVAMEQTKVQQEKLNKMVRHGKVVDVKPNEVTVNVTESGDKSVKGNITVAVDKETNIQKGGILLNNLGQPVDLTQELKPDMEVDLLVNNNKALAIYWEPEESTVQSQGKTE